MTCRELGGGRQPWRMNSARVAMWAWSALKLPVYMLQVMPLLMKLKAVAPPFAM